MCCFLIVCVCGLFLLPAILQERSPLPYPCVPFSSAFEAFLVVIVCPGCAPGPLPTEPRSRGTPHTSWEPLALTFGVTGYEQMQKAEPPARTSAYPDAGAGAAAIRTCPPRGLLCCSSRQRCRAGTAFLCPYLAHLALGCLLKVINKSKVAKQPGEMASRPGKPPPPVQQIYFFPNADQQVTECIFFCMGVRAVLRNGFPLICTNLLGSKATVVQFPFPETTEDAADPPSLQLHWVHRAPAPSPGTEQLLVPGVP